MNYRELPAPPALSRWIECCWTLVGAPATGTPAAPQRILPDGCIELILNFGDRFLRHEPDGSIETQPLFLVAGQIDRHILIEPTGRVDLLGIRFHPFGALPFLRVPLHELTGRSERIDTVATGLGSALEERLCGEQTSVARIAAVEQVLLGSLASVCEPDALVVGAVEQILRRRGQIAIGRLASRLGRNERQLERKFLEHVGLSPKRFSRIIRFQSIFQKIAASEETVAWADVALACGYFDQAHLAKDFKQLSGQSPGELLAEEAAVTEAFTRTHRVSETYKTVA